jgi:hypothetical protein
MKDPCGPKRSSKMREVALLGVGIIGVVVIILASLPMMYRGLVAAVEKRLTEATGLPWKIGGLSVCLDTQPCLRLRKVTIGGGAAIEDGKGLEVEQVRLTSEFAPLLGGAGKVTILADALNGEIPLRNLVATTPHLPSARQASLTTSLAAVHASAKGAQVSLRAAQQMLAVS